MRKELEWKGPKTFSSGHKSVLGCTASAGRVNLCWVQCMRDAVCVSFCGCVCVSVCGEIK